jgi:hypothetical protein
MAQLSTATRDFLEELAEFGSLWRSVDIRVIAVRVLDQWSNLITTCTLSVHDCPDVPPITSLVHTTHTLALHSVLPVAQLGAILERLAFGEIEICNEVIFYRTDEQLNEDQTALTGGEPYSWGNTAYVDRTSSYLQTPHSWSTLIYSAHGDSISKYLRHIPRNLGGLDQEIRTCTHPYDGFVGLAKQFAQAPDGFSGESSTHFKVTAPLPLRFARGISEFAEELRVGINNEALDSAVQYQLGYFASTADGSPNSGILDIAAANVVQYASDTILATFPAPSSGSVTVFLSVGSHCVDKLTLTQLPVRGSNTRIEAYKTIDPDLDYFRAGFYPAIRANPFAFEQAVARLFTFLGFTVDLLGPDKKISEGVDCLAYTQFSVLPIECTTGSIDAGGKLGKLVVRVRAVAAAVDQEVLGIIATPLVRERIASQELSRAGDDGIAVLTREALDHLYEMSLTNAPLDEATEFLASQVPARSSQDPMARLMGHR